MDGIAYAMVRRGEYAGARGCHFIGRVLGDYSTGFWAIKLDGRRMMSPEPYLTPEQAFEVLALEFDLHYGEALAAA